MLFIMRWYRLRSIKQPLYIYIIALIPNGYKSVPPMQAVSWATPRKDQSEASVDLRKAEIFINNRSGQELILPEDGKRGFKSMELYR